MSQIERGNMRSQIGFGKIILNTLLHSVLLCLLMALCFCQRASAQHAYAKNHPLYKKRPKATRIPSFNARTKQQDPNQQRFEFKGSKPVSALELEMLEARAVIRNDDEHLLQKIIDNYIMQLRDACPAGDLPLEQRVEGELLDNCSAVLDKGLEIDPNQKDLLCIRDGLKSESCGLEAKAEEVEEVDPYEGLDVYAKWNKYFSIQEESKKKKGSAQKKARVKNLKDMDKVKGN